MVTRQWAPDTTGFKLINPKPLAKASQADAPYILMGGSWIPDTQQYGHPSTRTPCYITYKTDALDTATGYVAFAFRDTSMGALTPIPDITVGGYTCTCNGKETHAAQYSIILPHDDPETYITVFYNSSGVLVSNDKVRYAMLVNQQP